MPRQRTADLCHYPMPSGQYCRQIALKGEYLCRHHARLYRHSEAETIHEQAMERLEAKLQSLDLIELLQVLSGKLVRLRSTVRACPEARLALAITIDRLESIQTGPAQPSPNPINFPENSMESMSQHDLQLQKVF